jgi:hypothetical protein
VLRAYLRQVGMRPSTVSVAATDVVPARRTAFIYAAAAVRFRTGTERNGADCALLESVDHRDHDRPHPVVRRRERLPADTRCRSRRQLERPARRDGRHDDQVTVSAQLSRRLAPSRASGPVARADRDEGRR